MRLLFIHSKPGAVNRHQDDGNDKMEIKFERPRTVLRELETKSFKYFEVHFFVGKSKVIHLYVGHIAKFRTDFMRNLPIGLKCKSLIIKRQNF